MKSSNGTDRKKRDVFKELARHLNSLAIGYPESEILEIILRENFSPAEAEAALALPNKVIPLQPVTVDEIAASLKVPLGDLGRILEKLAQRGLLFSGETKKGKKGYALQQVGFGFPQSFFWKNEESHHTHDMAEKVGRYFTSEKTREAYGQTKTKAFQFVPIGETLPIELQSVFPYQMMDKIIERAKVIAVAHCACRVASRLNGRVCTHPTEVCMKFDDMAEYLIKRKLAREIPKEEASDIIQLCQENNLVHFVDNAQDGIKHNCNCCGCACWSVARIRKRKIPRDVIMATYFIRETNEKECIGCEACLDVCPVDALVMENGVAKVDKDWCIGCGVCINKCPSQAPQIIIRPDKKDDKPATNFRKLHEQILEEKGLK